MFRVRVLWRKWDALFRKPAVPHSAGTLIADAQDDLRDFGPPKKLR